MNNTGSIYAVDLTDGMQESVKQQSVQVRTDWPLSAFYIHASILKKLLSLEYKK